MKEYYNDITRENLELIKTHRERWAVIKESTKANAVQVRILKETILVLKPQLAEAQAQQDSLEH